MAVCVCVFPVENVAVRRLCVQQDEPYGEIRITPGPSFTEEPMAV